jgi:hypothetical protein
MSNDFPITLPSIKGIRAEDFFTKKPNDFYKSLLKAIEYVKENPPPVNTVNLDGYFNCEGKYIINEKHKKS